MPPIQPEPPRPRNASDGPPAGRTASLPSAAGSATNRRRARRIPWNAIRTGLCEFSGVTASGMHIVALGGKGTEEPIEHDRHAAVVAVEIFRVGGMVHPVVRRPVEDPLTVEGGAVEPVRRPADLRHAGGQRRVARREEIEMPGGGHKVEIGGRRQRGADNFGIHRVRGDAIIRRFPQLHRHRDPR